MNLLLSVSSGKIRGDIFMTDTVERFSNRVENYVKYRPDYPGEIVAFLASRCGLTKESVVADVGCGTGISTRMFLENGNRVYGVEPNASMRAAAEKYLVSFPWFIPVDGTSVATDLETNSIDFVVAAQAFHWFDPEKTRAEFNRILKQNGHIDPDLFEVFVAQKVYLRYAEQFLDPWQIDAINLSPQTV